MSSFHLLVFSITTLLLTQPLNSYKCTSKQETSQVVSCPPFKTTPPFPFSQIQGCGHPSFQLNCSTPHSTISINGLSFSVLAYNPNSSSLVLSPVKKFHGCLFHSIPFHSINLSGTPFRVSESYCSRLRYLRSCSNNNPPSNLPNCSDCPYHCSLVKSPVRVFNECESGSDSGRSEEGCQNDVLEYIDQFLQFGFRVEFDESEDSFFAKCSVCRSNEGICGFNSSDPEKGFLCYQSRTRVSPPWIRHDDPTRIRLFCLVFTVLCLLFVMLVVTVIFRSRQLKQDKEDLTVSYLRRHRSAACLLPPVFSFEELELATDKFDPKRKIGDGGFGSVYLGHLQDGRVVAVKYLHKHLHSVAGGKALSTKLFCNEILILSSLNHPNLVKLHGYCSDPRGLILVYDYVPNGTLADHLHGRNYKGLAWRVRLDVALQIALAIEYLHCSVQPPIVHRDITCSNIFVEKDMRIKVGDFGLSRLLVFDTSSSSGSGFVWTGPQGTPGYLDPDYHRSFMLTEKSDIYSFGVIMLELVSGLRPVDQNRDKREVALADLAVSKIQMGLVSQLVDPSLGRDAKVMSEVEAVAELAFRCVAADKDDRPNAKEVVEELKQIPTRTVGE